MPSDLFRPGDSCLYSVFTTPDSLYSDDITYSGQNVSWDFSNIGMENQEIFHIINPASTAFDTAYIHQPDSATHATILKITDLPAPPTFAHFFQLNEGYNYFRLSDSSYSQIGLAANLAVPLANIPATNVAAHNYVQETIFPFPCHYGAADTCFTKTFLAIGSTGAYHSYKNKTVQVDGIGTLITPYKTFTGALKVSSHAVSVDTLWAIAMLGPDGMPVYRQINDYYWLVPGYRFPVMHINEHIFDVTFLTVQYLDTIREIPVYSVYLNNNTLNLIVGDTSRLSASVLPVNATHTSVIWSSEDTSIAEVSLAGLVKAKSVGNTKIYARSVQGNREAFCNVYVNPLGITNLIPLFSVELFPNPTEKMFIIRSSMNLQQCDVIIYNVCGLKIKQLKGHLLKDCITVSDLEKGIYLVEIISDQGKITKKLIIRN